MPLLKDGGELFAIIPFSKGAGTYRLEITVRGRNQSAAAAIMEISASGSGDASRKGVFKIDFKDKIYYDEAEAEADVLLMLNQVRERSGLEPFKLHPKLMDMAKSHAKDMAENNYMGHFSPEHGCF
jgi:uncharacterized protein YkwD